MAASAPESGREAEKVRQPEDGTITLPTLSPTVSEKDQRLRYLNNLLPAIGYLDLANGLDFPANVWNQVPVPLFAKVLMGVGGSIALLSSAFTVVDLRRSRKNIEFLRIERKLLKQRQPSDRQLWNLERAWLDVNFRELGWELIDRMLLDVSMLIAGVLVGVGTLMAIRGDIPAVYFASNLLSGYIGNAFVALYAAINIAWSIFMWKRAARNFTAFLQAKATTRPEIRRRFDKHTKRHQIYAAINGPTAVISGVGSLLSATKWPGYIVLIPGIIGSVFVNHYWRYKLGYSRDAIQHWVDVEDMDILDRIGVIVDIRLALRDTAAGGHANFCDMFSKAEKAPNRAILTFLRDHGLYQDFLETLRSNGFVHEMECTDPEHALRANPDLDFRHHPKVTAAVNDCIRAISKVQLRYEERFLSELYGCYCYWAETNATKVSPTTQTETAPSISPAVTLEA